MRIISGQARGRHLEAPKGLHTRPVTDKIRESLFNIWQQDICDAKFLDLFSGSGSMGIEAMSRGASKVIMVDNSMEAVRVIKDNIKNCGLSQISHEVHKEDVFGAIRRLENMQEKFDIIYLDPPFTVDEIFYPVMELLGGTNLLKEDGCVVIRTLQEKEMEEVFGNLVKYRFKKYGLSGVHFYGKGNCL